VVQTADIESVIRLVEITLTIGKNIVLIVSAIVAVTIALAVYDFATGDIAWGIVHSLLGLAGLVFLAQIRQTRRRHRARQARRRQMTEKYREAASA
jgi:hypothetical protein